MTDVNAKIGPQGTVELANNQSARLAGVSPMTPLDAAFLGRELLGCAAALASVNPPPIGTNVTDPLLSITAWATGLHPLTRVPTMILKIQPGIELSFVLTMQGAKDLSAGLLALAQGLMPPGGSRGVIH